MENTRFVNQTSGAAIPVVPTNGYYQLAKLVSSVFSPAVMAFVGTLLVASHIGTLTAWGWTFFEISLVIFIPLIFILWQLYKGRISDFDIYVRQQRNATYLVTIAMTTSLVIGMLFGNAPRLLLALMVASMLQMVIMYVVNLFWKISAHAAGVAGFASVCTTLFPVAALFTLSLIPLMVWSRVTLHRHTLRQTLAGAGLGLLLFQLAFIFIR
jgi:membrane-associated phospholipid phosphatase